MSTLLAPCPRRVSSEKGIKRFGWKCRGKSIESRFSGTRVYSPQLAARLLMMEVVLTDFVLHCYKEIAIFEAGC